MPGTEEAMASFRAKMQSLVANGPPDPEALGAAVKDLVNSCIATAAERKATTHPDHDSETDNQVLLIALLLVLGVLFFSRRRF